MNIALWIVNGVLALAFLAAGVMKLVRPRAALREGGMAWVDDFSPGAIKTISALEVLGALGLILPLLSGVAPVLAPLAAVGLTVIMIGAVVVHVRRREAFAPPLVLGGLAVVSAAVGFAVLL
ncbi:DoxX family protein [Microbacterium phosphatis]|uniref:DoxX family protein n=1 Tax=Microbacterium phosphatis TaxID=3140248 RepID=UPI0031400F85